MKMEKIRFFLNGKDVETEIEEGEILLHTLRERFRITSVKEGCSIGECGACTVLIENRPFYSCLTLSSKVRNRNVKTVEFLGREGLHPIQESFIRHGAVQCGYCTPGMLLSAYSLLLRNKTPTVEEVKKAISGNLCRCTGYVQIVDAIIDASSKITERMDDQQIPDRGCLSKDEILNLLASTENSLIIAGGTDLLISLREKKDAKKFIDVTSCKELKGIEKGVGKIFIGATTTHTEISESQILLNKANSLRMASESVGSPQIRNMGTIGGNIVNGSPAADTVPALLIHDARCILESKDGKRLLPLENFIFAPYRTRIERGELLLGVEIDELDGFEEGYVKVAKREALAISRVSFAYAIKEKDGFFEELRLAIGSVTPSPFRARKFEERLRGKERDKRIVEEACSILFEEIRRLSGDRPSYRYKFPVLRDLITSRLGR